MSPVLQSIELATLLPSVPGPQLVNGLGVEETWKAAIYAETGPTVAYVKMLEPNQVLSEVVCALVGLAFGLNIPKPFLVHVQRADLSQSRKWNANETQRICFGSEDARHPSFRQVLHAQQGHTNALMNQLLNWSGYKETAWFDEWTANVDSHIGNILFDGTDFWLIDHGHAFTGSRWVPGDLDPSKHFNNKFLSPGYVAKFNMLIKQEWISSAGAESLKYQAIALDALQECGMMDDYSDRDRQEAIINFLGRRAENFINLACDRLGVPRPLV